MPLTLNFLFFFFFSLLIKCDLNLTKILESLSLSNSLNLTLGQNVSYFLDSKYIFIEEEIYIMGENESKILMNSNNDNEDNEGSFSFFNNKKAFFSNLIFVNDAKKPLLSNFAFNFNNVQSIIFEVFFFYFPPLFFNIRVASLT